MMPGYPRILIQSSAEPSLQVACRRKDISAQKDKSCWRIIVLVHCVSVVSSLFILYYILQTVAKKYLMTVPLLFSSSFEFRLF